MLLRYSLALACIVGLSATLETPVSAQPGAERYAPPPQPLELQLSSDDLDALAIGHISTGRYVGGGLLGTYLGFGMGHAVQGRWADKGWIFTLGEASALTALIVGIVSCEAHADSNPRGHMQLERSDDCPFGLVIGGAIAYGGLRFWEMIDLWVAPPLHNERLKRLRSRQNQSRYGFAIVPTSSGSGVATLSLRF